MNKNQLDYTEVQSYVTCNPHIQERVFAYIADQLDGSGAEEVEDHLLECRDCREFFLKMLSIRKEAQQQGRLNGGEDCRTSNETLVPMLADYRKKWS